MSAPAPPGRILPPTFWRDPRRRRRPAALVALALLALVPAVALVLTARWASDEAAAREPVPLATGAPVTAPVAPTPVLSARRVPAAVADPVALAPLRAALDDIAAQLPASACLVVTVDGRTVYDVRGDRSLIPASNAKLLTAGAALAVLGADTRYRTSVLADAPVADGVVNGNLYLRGSGDPVLATAGYATYLPRIGKNAIEPHTSLEALADQLVAAGVRQVGGSVIGDESRYDTQRYLPTWPPGYRATNEIGPQTALSVNDGFSPYDPLTPSPAPATSAALVLTQLLQQRGVAVAGAPGEGPTPAGAVEVGGVDSAPVAEVVGEMLRESDNGTAELMLKELGAVGAAAGTTGAGAQVAAGALGADGVAMEGVAVVDGSGLSRDDRSTCRAFTSLLDDPQIGPGLEQAMAVAGQTGTLAEEGRFADSPAKGILRGKSGRLDGVSSLSGVVADGDGYRLSFSLLVNGPQAQQIAEPRWDELAAALVAYPQRPPLDAYAPAPAPAPVAAPTAPTASTASTASTAPAAPIGASSSAPPPSTS